MAQKVLIVEDEELIRNVLTMWLNGAGFDTFTAATARDGLRELYQQRPDLVITDVLMPGMDGYEFCERVREISDAPIMILTGLGKEEEKVKGLRMGADDYMVKPVSLDEFIARVEVLLRRPRLDSAPDTSSGRYTDGILTLDQNRHEILIKGEKVQLTPTEFKLLAFLIESPGKTRTFNEILDSVWDSPEYAPDVIKWHIAGLRSKIDEDADEDDQRIVTVRGIGYRYDPPL